MSSTCPARKGALGALAVLCAALCAAGGDALPAKCEALHRPGGVWRITVVEQPPFVNVRDPNNDSKPYLDTAKWSGFNVDLLRLVAAKCRFNYTLQLPHQRGTSAAALESYPFLVNETASYGGGQRDVWNNHSDMYWGAFYATPGRMEAGLVTLPVLHMPLRIVSRGEAQRPTFWSFAAPFSWVVWCAWICAAMLAGTVFWILEAGKAGEDFETHSGVTWDSFTENIVHSVWLSWQATTGCNTHTPSTKLGKLFSAVWSLFCIVMMASYTASLAAHLVQRDVTADVSGLNHLKSSGLKLCVQSKTAYAKSLALDHSLAPLLVPFDTVEKMQEGLMVEKSCAAMAHTGAAMQYAINTACKHSYDSTMTAVDVFNDLDQDMAVGLQKGYDNASAELSYHLTKLRHNGNISKLAHKYKLSADGGGGGCSTGGAEMYGSTDIELTVLDMHGVFVMFVAMAAACSISSYVKRKHKLRGKDGTLEGFLRNNFPSSSCSVQDIVDEWMRAWELRRILHPLVLTYLHSTDLKLAGMWATDGCTIQDVDNVTLVSSGAQVRHHKTELLRRKMMLAFHNRQSARCTIRGISSRIEIKLRILAEMARANVAFRYQQELNEAQQSKSTPGSRLASLATSALARQRRMARGKGEQAADLKHYGHDASFSLVFLAQSARLRDVITKVRGTILHASMGADAVVSLATAKASFKRNMEPPPHTPARADAAEEEEAEEEKKEELPVVKGAPLKSSELETVLSNL